ncbi:putative Alanine racemase family protein [Taphrina deformans PYCC 5710]|uniref:Pyridoxal phosphate homeostasis protein n=1 Tax=Taphrina deformans (strain PYCC 5710 / ATCC 11124 / CBS 356.35 / IMI 108563 / JCM 9778 / NBRC 8474) TaxID=1097556 RepID=R4XBR1_TAPDE|nr:putative Alanine racemase family protein [Taphrina deformans PYCC 5710]|eukprot:CCG83015.1 putative Alanine racemase family protein [Taphrina deformans PYCC 5710]
MAAYFAENPPVKFDSKKESPLNDVHGRLIHCHIAFACAHMSSDARTTELRSNYDKIRSNVPSEVTLVAVSKLKPSSDIQILYDHGVRHFGENYIQELISKSEELPGDIKWHFIGSLQSNKAKLLASSVRGLYAVETVDSVKKANELNKGCRERTGRLNVYIQINTSDEPDKSGVSRAEAGPLARHIIEACDKLSLLGVMTIGALATSRAHGEENRDFSALKRVKADLDAELGVSLVLSMGMSEDYPDAIEQGSNEVRVGSSIFGARPPKKSERVEADTAEEKE